MTQATHSVKRIQETHDGKTYLVPRRNVEETWRLEALVEELAVPCGWSVVRQLGNGQKVSINVDALTGGEAAAIANEVHYALNWRGGFINVNGRGQPEEWALNYPKADIINLRS